MVISNDQKTKSIPSAIGGIRKPIPCEKIFVNASLDTVVKIGSKDGDLGESQNQKLALEFKKDGNNLFKQKRYKEAINAYTNGFKCRSSDNLVNVLLLTNRAAAHYHLEEYESMSRVEGIYLISRL